MPPWQLVEQHWAPPVQVLPSVVQAPAPPSAWQLPPVQVSLQQSAAAAQAAPTVAQPTPVHCPPVQESEQQSVAFWHATPEGRQKLAGAQTEGPPSTAVQTPEQQGAPVATSQVAPVSRQAWPLEEPP